jgi:hypothetical protein
VSTVDTEHKVTDDIVSNISIGKASLSNDALPETGSSSSMYTPAAIHQLFGHMSNSQITKIVKNNALKDLEADKIGKILQNDTSTSTCTACMLGKGKRSPFKRHSNHEQMKKSAERLFGDISGPIECAEKDECYGMIRGKYLSLIVDEYSRWCHGRMIMNKSAAVKHVKEFIVEAERQTGNKVKYLHTDGGSEYSDGELVEFLRLRGIKSESTCTYTPEHNGVVERANGIIWQTALTLVAAAKLDKKKFIGEAINYSIYLWNNTVRNSESKSRNELWNDSKASFKKLHPFGCDAYVTVPKDTRKKCDDKISRCIYLGVDDKHIGGYRCLDIDHNKLVISRDVKFNHFSFTFGRSDQGGEVEIERRAIDQLEMNSLVKFNQVMLDKKDTSDRVSSERKSTRTKQQTQRYGYTDTKDYYYEDVRQSHGKLNYTNCVYKAMEMLSNHELSNEPLTYEEAMQSSEREEWMKANQSELDSLEKNNTWKLVHLPKGSHTIQCKWVYKKKPDLQGNIARYKARLVAKGFTQVYGIDYKETYAPVGKIKSLLMLLSLANQLNYELNHLDVETAFLNANVEEDIYMDLPEGYKISKGTMKESSRDGRPVLKLIKSIYGIKQAPHNWNALINSTLVGALGFNRLQSDTCIYVKKSKTGHLIFLFIWVDDMLGIYSPDDKAEWSYMKSQLMNHYKMKDMGDLQMILGMRINRDREQQIIRIDQGLYIQKILKKFNMEYCSPVHTPESTADLGSIQAENSEENNNYMKKVPYREAIGALLYASICTRPDIAHAVNQVSQFQINPTPAHWVAVKRIIKYLNTYPNIGLEFKGMKNNDTNVHLHCYCDADWAQSKLDRKSVGGYLVRLNNDVISWQVKKQSTVALSSTEAEYMQMTQAAKELKWFINLFSELYSISNSNYYIPTTVMKCDNRSAIDLSKNDIYHDRTKHIDLRYHFIRDCVQAKLFSIMHVPTAEQQADIFTKGLQRNLFTKFRNLIMASTTNDGND